MTARYLGGKSVGETVPTMPITLAQLQALMLPSLSKQSDISARLALPFTPPNPTVMLAALQAQIASLAATLGQLPALDAKARVSLGADLAALGALLAPARALVATVGGALSTGGLHLYALDSRVGSLGSDLSGATEAGLPGGGGPNANAKALVVVTESPSAWKALGAVVRTG